MSGTFRSGVLETRENSGQAQTDLVEAPSLDMGSAILQISSKLIPETGTSDAVAEFEICGCRAP